ncbi:hypothetical protein LZL87_013188 [Fusarium oxysporum]|nr:hypothetical protein LZL87_013188 [Fusarium oxysporum]
MVNRTFSITAEVTLLVEGFAGALKTLGYLGQITDPKEGMFAEKGEWEYPKSTVVNIGGDNYELAENVLAGLPP